MGKRNKIIKVIIFNSLILCMLFISFYRVKAVELPKIHYIFDKQMVKQDEEFSLTLILENYSDLSTVQFVCEVDKNVFMPVIKNNQYFNEPTLSLFDKSEIYENDYLIDDGILRFVAITKGGKSYDYSGLNQVFTISFKANQDIDKVEEYFYEQDSFGSRVLLIDKWAKELKGEVFFNEILKANWNKEIYEIEVFDDLPNVLEDIIVQNRNSNEYKIEIIKEELNLDIIGSTVIKVKIYDYLTSQIIYLAKPIKIVDTTPPIIEVLKNEIVIDDVKLSANNFEYFIVSDNYDKIPNVIYKYYDGNNQEILTLQEFKRYLRTNQTGKIICYAIDSCNNKSEEKVLNVKIKDTTAPYINELTVIEVIDVEVDKFDLESYIIISDEYDVEPKFLYKIHTNDNNNYANYLEALKTIYNIVIEYWAEDASGNVSKHVEIEVKLKDTTAPVLENVYDVVIQDEDLVSYLNNHYLLEKDFVMIDNFNYELTLEKIYYQNEEIILEENFFNNLKKGLEGSIKYQVVDYFGNKSEILTQKVSVLDDTSPNVLINNLEDNKQYLGPIKIEYQVQDNIDDMVDVEVLVNGNIYQGEELIDFSEYNLVIIAVDASGNKTSKEINFEIVEENFFGCIDGFDCAENNYALGLIIGLGIIIIVGAVVVLEIFYIKKKKKEQESY